MDYHPVACPFCPCHCDDLRLIRDGGHLELDTPECSLARAGYHRFSDKGDNGQSKEIQKVLELIRGSRSMVMVVSGEATNECVRPAVELARLKKAVITTSDFQQDWSLAVGRTGWLSATMGELKKIKGPLALCGLVPAELPPRFWEKIGTGKQKNNSSLSVDDPLMTMRWLRLMCRKEFASVPKDFRNANQALSSETSGIVVLGERWLAQGEHVILETLQWMNELNAKGRWYGTVLPSTPNAQGATEMLKSATGFPGSVRFLGSQPDFSPRELVLEKMLERCEADLLLMLGNPTPLSPVVKRPVKGVKSIVISNHTPEWKPTCWVKTATPGIDSSGSMLRFDGLPVQLEKWVESSLPSMEMLLEDWSREVRQ